MSRLSKAPRYRYSYQVTTHCGQGDIPSLKTDYDYREFIESVELLIRRTVDFLSEFQSSAKFKLSNINQRLTTMERKMDFIQASLEHSDPSSRGVKAIPMIGSAFDYNFRANVFKQRLLKMKNAQKNGMKIKNTITPQLNNNAVKLTGIKTFKNEQISQQNAWQNVTSKQLTRADLSDSKSKEKISSNDREERSGRSTPSPNLSGIDRSFFDGDGRQIKHGSLHKQYGPPPKLSEPPSPFNLRRKSIENPKKVPCIKKLPVELAAEIKRDNLKTLKAVNSVGKMNESKPMRRLPLELAAQLRKNNFKLLKKPPPIPSKVPTMNRKNKSNAPPPKTAKRPPRAPAKCTKKSQPPPAIPSQLNQVNPMPPKGKLNDAKLKEKPKRLPLGLAAQLKQNNLKSLNKVKTVKVPPPKVVKRSPRAPPQFSKRVQAPPPIPSQMKRVKPMSRKDAELNEKPRRLPTGLAAQLKKNNLRSLKKVNQVDDAREMFFKSPPPFTKAQWSTPVPFHLKQTEPVQEKRNDKPKKLPLGLAAQLRQNNLKSLKKMSTNGGENGNRAQPAHKPKVRPPPPPPAFGPK